MLVIDAEFTGLDPKTSAILSIGAVDFENPDRQFYEECRPFEGAELNPESLAVCGFSEEECYDSQKNSQRQIMEKFLKWIRGSSPDKTIVGQNAYLDRDMINEAFKREGIDFNFHFRIIELHSVAYFDMLKKGIEPPKNGAFSALNLDGILNYIGLPKEPKPHNALTGAKVEAEALHRMLHGKYLLDDFKEFEVPEIFKR